MAEKPTIAYKDETGYHTFYTIHYITKEDPLTFAKTSHGSEDGDNTVCGIDTLETKRWYLANNTFDGIITCKKCIKILEEKIK